MIIFILLIGATVSVQLFAEKASKKHPKYSKQIMGTSKTINWLLVIGLVAFIAYGYFRPEKPKIIEPLPSDIHVPSLKASSWTAYLIDPKEGFNLYIQMPPQRISKNLVRAWDKLDNIRDDEITVSQVEYDCDIGRATEVVVIKYKDGQYQWFDRPDPKDATSKVDLDTVGGSAYQAACFNKLPALER